MEKKLYLMMGLAAVGAVSETQAAARPEKPNVLLVLIDDLGWQGVGCYDIDNPTMYETPNLDKFANESVLFWQAYSPAPTSAPSRGAIMSGKAPARLQRTHVIGGTTIKPRSANSNIMTPWYAGRLSTEEVTLAEILKPYGYVSGHSGKWHMAKDHGAYPHPIDQGFDFSFGGRGVTQSMKPHRATGWATDAPNDPYRIDSNGFPRDEVAENAVKFMDENKDKPFFMYYASWLVHSPIQSRSKELVEKYAKKMGKPFPTSGDKLHNKTAEENFYYAAMVEMMDHYFGQMIEFLKKTDDPRWPGHKLYDNTYVIFTSDNGGAEGGGSEIYTDNFPLDKGKSHAQEGGIRVPLMIAGPGIKKGVQTNVMANGVDFYPTILSWTGAKLQKGQIIDGADLSVMLEKNPNDASLVKLQNGKTREFMVHHFPHSEMHSAIRDNQYKLLHNFDPKKDPQLELYQLYDKNGKRVDIEEQKNLAKKMPEKAAEMDKKLMEMLGGYNASLPYLNPTSPSFADKKANFPTIIGGGREGDKAWVNYKNNKNKVVAAFVVYKGTENNNDNEWFRMPAMMVSEGRVEVDLPKGTTDHIFGLIDNENFYFDFPKQAVSAGKKSKGKKAAASAAPAKKQRARKKAK